MYLLFDFDGTLVKSYQHVIEKINILAERFHCRKINEQEIESLRDLSSRELIKFLNIPFYKIPLLIRNIRHLLHDEMGNMQPVTNISQVLETFYNAGCTLGILTSNSIENVVLWLEMHNIRHFFDFIHNESNYFSKRFLLKKTLKKYGIDKEKTLYIGDETRDIEAAKKNRIRSVAVTWGYNSERILLAYQPTFIAQHPEELLAICLQEKKPI
ncbi:Pyrophosphatase PpaX [Legionella massiliensis]|uniref:Pyrophosphatase PpaX n=1 Tax=Legionella massiliensis TaxID=1034943 RepID=A0A078KRV6_9GAMM|nr:HAD hydrolase-like protein [Legionella massiliensis]CDZ75831.1 Pyrophosphatase PpaX [Legionella massiliensis]CEE11569.1 Pyrophosphatase PpaX [Legionella massiliensis]